VIDGPPVLEIIDRKLDYGVAHPDNDSAASTYPCDRCALSVRPDTGELVLLWLCGGINWSISRANPDHDRHRGHLHAGRFALP
jgi:hypothetical protein